MTPRDAKTELIEARNALEQMYVEMDSLETRIAKQKRVIAALTELADMAEDSEPPVGLVKGITDACKTAVLGSDKPLYPSEVRDRIKTLGFPEQTNLLASVHTVLKRLAEGGEIRALEDGSYRRMTFGERLARTAQRTAAGKPPIPPAGRLAKQIEAERSAIEEMRKAGSEIGTPRSLEPPPARSLRPQERFNLGHTKGK